MPSSLKDQAGAILTDFVKRPADIIIQSLPNLKAIVEDTIFIATFVQDFKSNTNAWGDFAKYLQAAVAQVLMSIDSSHILAHIQGGESTDVVSTSPRNQDLVKRNPEQQSSFLDNLLVLHKGLTEIRERTQELRDQPKLKRITTFYHDPALIQDMRQKLDDLLQLFNLGAVTHIGLNLDKVAEDVKQSLQYSRELSANVNQVAATQVQQGQNATLDRLPYVAHASWDKNKVCLPGTRKLLLDTIETWLKQCGPGSYNNAQIMVWTAVAGAGKSTLMHSIAERCASNESLASAFFFDRAVEGRNNASALFSTIAVDLCRFDQGLAALIIAAVEKDRSVISASVTRQFEELVFESLAAYKGDRPLVILIDALDEGIDAQPEKAEILLNIFRDRIPKLPPTVRFVLTYRAQPSIDIFFRDQPHVHSSSIDIRSDDNLADIALAAEHEFSKVARLRCLGDNWPGPQLIAQFTQKSEGLFQWAAMACGYLSQCISPDRELKLLLTNPGLTGASSEAKMDLLYKTILDSFRWGDSEFANGFGLVMGTIVAVKTPISSSAMHSFHRQSPVPIDTILHQISSFTTGWSAENPSQPVQIMHQSLLEFLTVRASLSDETQRYCISEQQWSQELALPCLNILNQQLNAATPGTGFIWGTKTLEIPKFARNRVSEELLYAAQFWMDHLLDCGNPTAGIAMALRTFLSVGLVQWVEFVSAHGRYPGLKRVLDWIKVHLSDRSGILKHVFNSLVARSLRTLNQHLTHMDRPEEALLALQDAMEIMGQLEPEGKPTDFEAEQGSATRVLSSQLCEAGREDEAISAVEQALEINRKLAAENPDKYTAQLAATLDTYATVMSKAGRHAHSLPHMLEAVELYRKLATAEPGEYSDDLARCGNNLAAHYGRMGYHEEALTYIHDSISAYRYLVQEQPGIHTSHLANSLSNLYAFLSGLGRHAEALPYMQESVEIRRRLAAERPAAYTHDLASALSNLAAGMSHLNQEVEALPIMRDSIELSRGLYKERPAAHHIDLARGLFNFSSHLLGLHQYGEALEVTEEAIDLYKPMAEKNPAAYSFGLATLYSRLHRSNQQLDKEDEAFAAILEAVRFYRLVTDSTETGIDHRAALATALTSLSISFAKVGMEEECIEPASEAVQLVRERVRDDPENIMIRYQFGQGLLGLVRHLNRAGRPEEAHVYCAEAVETYQELAKILPTEHSDDLAESYGQLAYCLNLLGHADDALAAGIEELSLYQDLASENPKKFGPKVLEAFVTVIKSMLDMGDNDMGMQMMTEMMSTYRQIMQTNPGCMDERLSTMFNQLANVGQGSGVSQFAGLT